MAVRFDQHSKNDLEFSQGSPSPRGLLIFQRKKIQAKQKHC